MNKEVKKTIEMCIYSASCNLALLEHPSTDISNGSDRRMTLAELLRGMLANQQVLAEACGVELPFVVSELELEQLSSIANDDRVKEGGIVLPLALRSAMLHAEAFDAAVEKGYIEMTEDGHLTWMLGSTTLLAYFLGRLFSGDYGRYSKGKKGTLWMRGKKAFPAKELQQLFGESSLRKLRENREGRLLPENFELVDGLFSIDN